MLGLIIVSHRRRRLRFYPYVSVKDRPHVTCSTQAPGRAKTEMAARILNWIISGHIGEAFLQQRFIKQLIHKSRDIV